jgi:hypothetical protein
MLHQVTFGVKLKNKMTIQQQMLKKTVEHDAQKANNDLVRQQNRGFFRNLRQHSPLIGLPWGTEQGSARLITSISAQLLTKDCLWRGGRGFGATKRGRPQTRWRPSKSHQCAGGFDFSR